MSINSPFQWKLGKSWTSAAPAADGLIDYVMTETNNSTTFLQYINEYCI
jgi:hypothetical protein